jgi:hypothetical protein
MTEDIKQPNSLVVQGPFACVREVRATGYEWDTDLRLPSQSSSQDADNQPSPWLVGGFVGIQFDCLRFQPLYVPGLHRQFGRLKPTCKAIKRFADRCGLLEDGEFLIYPELGRPQDTKFGESLQFWKKEIEMMGALLDLWDSIQSKRDVHDLFRVRSHPHYPRSISIEWHFPSGARSFHNIAHEGILSQKESLAGMWKGDVSSVHSYLLNKLEERLEGHVNPQFTLSGSGQRQILMVPDSLLSALYLSFALEVNEQPGPKVQCECGCGRDFFPEHGRKFYDKGCKNRNWWRRKRGKKAV